jgi:hypothetical protein
MSAYSFLVSVALAQEGLMESFGVTKLYAKREEQQTEFQISRPSGSFHIQSLNKGNS